MLKSRPANLSISSCPELKHEPLPHSITHIRVLEIQPQCSPGDREVRCRMKCVRLTDFDKCYVAVSYAWDHDAQDTPIIVNGQVVKVKANVCHILRTYRQKLAQQEMPAVFIWVDALCIDYGNVAERNCQAQIMPNIYQRAKTVLTWVQASAARMPQDTRNETASFTRFLKQAKVDLGLMQDYSNDRVLTRKYLSPSNGCLERWHFLMQICQNAYWTRLWILPETRFAENLLLVYGDTVIMWEHFCAPFVLAWYLTESQLFNPGAGHIVEPLQVLRSPAFEVLKLRLDFNPVRMSQVTPETTTYASYISEKWHDMSRDPLTSLLAKYGKWQCSDPRDKIYALIGMSDSLLTIDYDRTNIELFCTALLTLKLALELKVLSSLAHQLDVSAFKYHQNRRTLIMGVPSTMPEQTAVSMVGRPCDTNITVKLIPNRIEISDLLQSRLGVQKLKLYRVIARQKMDSMKNWNEFPDTQGSLPRIHGHTPGTSMPIVDGFDLSQTSFRPAMFCNPFVSSRKAVLGMVSTGDIQEGDLLVAEERMQSGLIIRISGLAKTWLTVVGVVMFARRVTVESDVSPFSPISASDTCRSTSLSEFCECTQPTSFTISDCDDKEHFRLKPNDVQLQSISSGSNTPSGRLSRSSTRTNTSIFTTASTIRPNERRFTSKSDRMERFMDNINPLKRRNTAKSDSSLFSRRALRS